GACRSEPAFAMVPEPPEALRQGLSEERVLDIACGDYSIGRILSQIRQSELESASMNNHPSSLLARREFLKFLAASPYVAAAGGVGAFVRLPGASAEGLEAITDPAGALNVFDFEEA